MVVVSEEAVAGWWRRCAGAITAIGVRRQSLAAPESGLTTLHRLGSGPSAVHVQTPLSQLDRYSMPRSLRRMQTKVISISSCNKSELIWADLKLSVPKLIKDGSENQTFRSPTWSFSTSRGCLVSIILELSLQKIIKPTSFVILHEAVKLY